MAIKTNQPGIFLSHSHADKGFARHLARDLAKAGARVWIDDAEILLGDSLIEKIRAGIDDMEYLGVILSPQSVSSQWVKKEVEIAMNEEIDGKRIKVLPLLHQPCEFPGFLKGKKYADFSSEDKYADSLRLVLRRLGLTLPDATFVKEQRLNTREEASRPLSAADFAEVQDGAVTIATNAAMFKTLSPSRIFSDAQKAVPAVRYAAGVASIAAVVAIVAGFQLDTRIAVFGTMIVMGLMFVLVILSALVAHAGPALVKLALFAAWSSLLLTLATSAMLMTSYFFAWPRSIEFYLPPPTPADEILNFDTENTYSDPKKQIDAEEYLGAFGVQVSNKTPGTRVVLMNHLGVYDGKAFLPASQPNVLTQMGSLDPVTFTLNFSRPLSRLSFVMPPLIAATKSGITFPRWHAYGLNGRGVEIGIVGSSYFGSYLHERSKVFTLQVSRRSGDCIKAVRFDSDSEHHAAFAAVLIDDLSLWYAPANSCQ